MVIVTDSRIHLCFALTDCYGGRFESNTCPSSKGTKHTRISELRLFQKESLGGVSLPLPGLNQPLKSHPTTFPGKDPPLPGGQMDFFTSGSSWG